MVTPEPCTVSLIGSPLERNEPGRKSGKQGRMTSPEKELHIIRAYWQGVYTAAQPTEVEVPRVIDLPRGCVADTLSQLPGWVFFDPREGFFSTPGSFSPPNGILRAFGFYSTPPGARTKPYGFFLPPAYWCMIQAELFFPPPGGIFLNPADFFNPHQGFFLPRQ